MLSNDRVPAHLRDVRRIESPEPESDDEDKALAWGWPSSKPVFGVSLEKPDGLKRSFRYMHLESDMVYKDGTIEMRFTDTKSYKVTITGLRLERLFYLLQDDRMRAVRQSAREFDVGENDPLIKSIVIEELKHDLED